MQRWTGIVLALPEAGSEEMASRLVTYLHPVAGRPLIWHTVATLGALQPAPERVVVIAGAEITPEAFGDLPVAVDVLRAQEFQSAQLQPLLAPGDDAHVLVVDATTFVLPEGLQPLLGGPSGTWLPAGASEAAAVWLARTAVGPFLSHPDPLRSPQGLLEPQRAAARGFAHRVEDRVHLAQVVRAVRDRLVQRLMRAGATFLIPDSVMVDVDVRVGRDSVVYPGVVLEGQTTIGEETVIGPGCRVIDSWIGSGVELKGWNYVSHTSIRNRAILEPYVRRGFD